MINTALGAVGTLRRLIGLLDAVTELVNNDINMLEIQSTGAVRCALGAHMHCIHRPVSQCIRDFLLRLPDPRGVQQQVDDLYNQLEGGYRPSVVALRDALADTQVWEEGAHCGQCF